ncbi:hypothetical protein OfM1_19200 [Lactovum odontotermitis]
MKETEKKQSERRPDSYYPPLMGREEATEFLLGNQAVNTFDSIAAKPDFPKVRGIDSKTRYPRDAMLRWMSEHWEVLA